MSDSVGITIQHDADRHSDNNTKTPDSTRSYTSVPPLQTVVQLNIYRDKDGEFEYLLLKRIDGDTMFWQVVTQPVHSGATLGDTLRQAASEQVGLRGFKHLSHEMYSYEWYTNGERGRDIVFAAEVSPDAIVTPDRERYNDYAWLPIEEALQHLKWNGNRTALRKLDDHLVDKRAAAKVATPDLHLQQSTPSTTYSGLPMGSDIPTPYEQENYSVARIPVVVPPAGSLPAATSTATGQPTPGQPAGSGPYGPNVPKRLPDQPSAIAATSRPEINPAELFL